jgi:hypothetical protein
VALLEWISSEKLWLPFGGNVLHDGHAFCYLVVLVEKIWQVREVHAKVKLIICPLGVVEVWGRSASILFVLEVDLAVV